MKKLLTFMCVALLLAGCSYEYFSPRAQKKYRRNSGSVVTQHQLAQLRVLDTASFRNGGGVFIQPIMANRKNVGVYAYNRRSSHFGRVHFFAYRNDSVILIPRENEDSLKAEVQRFLRAHNFSKRRISVAMKRLHSTYAILSTDSF
jgi:hypothetical protein